MPLHDRVVFPKTKIANVEDIFNVYAPVNLNAVVESFNQSIPDQTYNVSLVNNVLASDKFTTSAYFNLGYYVTNYSVTENTTVSFLLKSSHTVLPLISLVDSNDIVYFSVIYDTDKFIIRRTINQNVYTESTFSYILDCSEEFKLICIELNRNEVKFYIDGEFIGNSDSYYYYQEGLNIVVGTDFNEYLTGYLANLIIDEVNIFELHKLTKSNFEAPISKIDEYVTKEHYLLNTDRYKLTTYDFDEKAWIIGNEPIYLNLDPRYRSVDSTIVLDFKVTPNNNYVIYTEKFFDVEVYKIYITTQNHLNLYYKNTNTIINLSNNLALLSNKRVHLVIEQANNLTYIYINGSITATLPYYLRQNAVGVNVQIGSTSNTNYFYLYYHLEYANSAKYRLNSFIPETYPIFKKNVTPIVSINFRERLISYNDTIYKTSISPRLFVEGPSTASPDVTNTYAVNYALPNAVLNIKTRSYYDPKITINNLNIPSSITTDANGVAYFSFTLPSNYTKDKRYRKIVISVTNPKYLEAKFELVVDFGYSKDVVLEAIPDINELQAAYLVENSILKEVKTNSEISLNNSNVETFFNSKNYVYIDNSIQYTLASQSNIKTVIFYGFKNSQHSSNTTFLSSSIDSYVLGTDANSKLKRDANIDLSNYACIYTTDDQLNYYNNIVLDINFNYNEFVEFVNHFLLIKDLETKAIIQAINLQTYLHNNGANVYTNLGIVQGKYSPSGTYLTVTLPDLRYNTEREPGLQLILKKDSTAWNIVEFIHLELNSLDTFANISCIAEYDQNVYVATVLNANDLQRIEVYRLDYNNEAYNLQLLFTLNYSDFTENLVNFFKVYKLYSENNNLYVDCALNNYRNVYQIDIETQTITLFRSINCSDYGFTSDRQAFLDYSKNRRYVAYFVNNASETPVYSELEYGEVYWEIKDYLHNTTVRVDFLDVVSLDPALNHIQVHAILDNFYITNKGHLIIVISPVVPVNNTVYPNVATAYYLNNIAEITQPPIYDFSTLNIYYLHKNNFQAHLFTTLIEPTDEHLNNNYDYIEHVLWNRNFANPSTLAVIYSNNKLLSIADELYVLVNKVEINPTDTVDTTKPTSYVLAFNNAKHFDLLGKINESGFWFYGALLFTSTLTKEQSLEIVKALEVYCNLNLYSFKD